MVINRNLHRVEIRAINHTKERELINYYQQLGKTLLNVQKKDGVDKNQNRSKDKDTAIPLPTLEPPNLVSNDENNKGNGKCISFEVTNTQNIAQVAAQVPNLPTGPCTITIRNMNNRNQILFGQTRHIRTIGRTVTQFFNATNDNVHYKWEVLQNEMNRPGAIVPIAIVEVCPIIIL